MISIVMIFSVLSHITLYLLYIILHHCNKSISYSNFSALIPVYSVLFCFILDNAILLYSTLFILFWAILLFSVLFRSLIFNFSFILFYSIPLYSILLHRPVVMQCGTSQCHPRQKYVNK